MATQAERPRSAHLVVLGNEKGGSGKSTTAIHVTVGLLNAGQKVATIDLDSRQKSFTHYLENRRAWARRTGAPLSFPVHHCVTRANGIRVDENEQVEFKGFAEAITAVEREHDFVVVDTPGMDSYLTRLAHSMADTLITPLNDSYVDFDVLANVDPTSFTVEGESHYSEMVREARRQHRSVTGRDLDWVVVRNRLSQLGSRNKQRIGDSLRDLGGRLGFRFVDGFSERVVYREFFPRGLTALDPLDTLTLGTRPSLSHLAAQREIMELIEVLRLPVDADGRQRALARGEWFATQHEPCEVDDLLT